MKATETETETEKNDDPLKLIRTFLEARIRSRAFPNKDIEVPEWILQQLEDAFREWAYSDETLDALLGLEFGPYKNRQTEHHKQRIKQRNHELIREMLDRTEAGMTTRAAAKDICEPSGLMFIFGDDLSILEEPYEDLSIMEEIRENLGVMEKICESLKIKTISYRSLARIFTERQDLRDIIISWDVAFKATSSNSPKKQPPPTTSFY